MQTPHKALKLVLCSKVTPAACPSPCWAGAPRHRGGSINRKYYTRQHAAGADPRRYPAPCRRCDEEKSTGRQSQLPALPQGHDLPDGDGLALVAQREAP